MNIQLELHSDLVDLQSLLLNLSKKTDSFANMKYRGGNEMKINSIINSIEQFLESKNYITQRKHNLASRRQLQDIVLFLVLNTDFTYAKTCFNQNSIHHLTNVVPPLSKCLLAHIITELDLAMFYAIIFSSFPDQFAGEMLPDVVECLKKSPPVIFREQSYLYLKEIISKLQTMNTVNSDAFQAIEDAAIEILLYMSKFNVDMASGFTKRKLYEHIGHIVLNLCKLLQSCAIDNPGLSRLIDNLIRTTSTVYQAVSVDVYIEWAEFKINDDMLQMVISWEAYNLLEKYQKYKPAKELIQMIGTIAKKPSTLAENILISSIETIISKVNDVNTPHRDLWFNAMINTTVFENKEVIECLKNNSHLCTLEDVLRLLHMSVRYRDKNPEIPKLVLKCSKSLTTPDLKLAIIRYYRQHGLFCDLSSNSPNLLTNFTLLMNKLVNSTSGTNANETFVHDLLLLMLEHLTVITRVLFCECLKNEVYSRALNSVFVAIKDVIVIENLASYSLEIVLGENRITQGNVNSFIGFFNMIKETQCVEKCEDILQGLLKTEFEKQGELEGVLYMLQVFNGINGLKYTDDLSTLLINILHKNRCKFFDYSAVKMEICSEVLKIFKSNNILHKTELDEECETLSNRLTLYYATTNTISPEITLLKFIYPDFSTENYSESVSKILKLLPSCVTEEWLNISSTIETSYGTKMLLELLTDVLVLICQVANSAKINQQQCFNSLKYCLTNYGTVIQNILLSKNLENIQLQPIVVKKICLIVKHIPLEIQESEGLKLFTLLSDKLLSEMGSDKEFIFLLAALGNAKIAQVIAQKVNKVS